MNEVEKTIQSAGAIAEFAKIYFAAFKSHGFNDAQSLSLTKEVLHPIFSQALDGARNE